MVARVFRTTIFAGVLLAIWTLGRPAHAAALAPFCDDRGATALAAPPALEASDEAIQRAAAPPCETDAPIFLSLGPARHAVGAAPAAIAPAETIAPLRVLPPPLDGLVAFVSGETPPQSGVRYRVERPPRG